MNSIRKWLYKPKKTDKSLLAQFYFADEDLNKVATELDSFDSRKDPERCHALVSQLRVCQDKVLTIVQRIMVEAIPFARTSRDFRVKFPDDVVQENLAGQLWFGAECLAAGSSIMNRELESASMRPLARALTKNLDSLRHILRDQCLISVNEYSERIREALTIFDKLFAEFELSYVSAMVPVKSVKEYETIQEITVLFSETTIRAKSLGYITTDMIDEYDPALMFTIPRLAIVCGLLIFVDGPLNPDSQSWNMSDMFRPFQTLLYKIRELLFTLSDAELLTLERALCSQEEPDFLASSTAQYNNNTVSSFVPTSTSTIGIQTEGLFVDKVTSEDARPPRNLERLGSNGSEQRKQRVGSGHVEEIVCQSGPMTEPGDVVLQELQEDTPRPTAYCGDLVHQESNLNKSDSNDSGLHSDVVSSSDSQVTISSSDSNQLLCHSGVHSDVVSSSDSQVTISSSDSNQLLCHSGLASPLPGPSADQAAENCTEQSQDLQVLMHQSSSAVAEHKNLNSDNNPDKICVNCSADVVTESQETVASLPEEEDEDEEQFYTPSSGVSPLHQPPVGGHTGQSHQSSHSGQVHHPSHRRVKEAVPVSLSHKERSRNVDDVLQDDHCPGDQIWNAGDFSQLNSNSNSDNLDDSKEGDYEKQMDCISHFDGVRGSVYSGRDCSSLPVIIGGDASSLAVLSERDSSSLPVLSGGEYSNLPILSGGEYSNLQVLSGGEYSNLTEQLHSVRQKVQTVFRGEVAGELETAAVASEFSEHSITDATLTDVTPLSDTSLALSSDSSCTYFSAQPNCSDSVNVVHCDSGGSGIQQTCCDSINENQKLSVKNSLPSQSEVVSTDFVSSAADSTGLKSDLSQKHCDRCTQTPHSVINNDLSSKIHHHHHYHSCQHSSSPSSSTPASSTHPSSKFFSHNRQEGIAVKTEKTNSSKSDFRTLQLQNVKKERVDKIQRTSISRVHSARTQKTSQRTRVLKTQHGAQEKVIKLRQYTDNWSDCSSNSEDQTRENQQGGYLQGAMDTSSGSSGCEGTSSASDCESDQDSCGSSETSSYNSESHDDEEIALAVQAAELANRNQARARFRSSSDMIHRLFVCISGVADQLQTNFAGDLRNILRVVFNLNCSEPVVMEDEKSFRRYRRRGAQFFHQQFGVDSRSQNSYLRDPPAWIPDDQSTMCMSCKTPFTFVRRRHHCRNCGKIFCGRCSSNAVSLPHFGHSNPVRVCNHCFVFQVNPFAAQAHL